MLHFLLLFLRRYFGFSRRESRGFLLVFPMLVLLYLVPGIFELASEKKRSLAYERYLQAAETALKLDPQAPRNEISQDSAKQEKKSGSTQENEKTVPRLQRSSTPLLNTVFFHETDSVLLQMVAGIGPVLSGRIIKFRELVGGFHQPEQILDVYGLSAEVAERVYTMFPFKAEITKKVRINEVDAKQLSEHPYISPAEAKVIIAFRNQHGPFQNAGDLLKIKIFNENWVKRIEPYVMW